MRLNLCLLNIPYSGANAHLIRELSRRVDLQIVGVPVPTWLGWLLKAKAFHPVLNTWKRRYDRALSRAIKSHGVFACRSRLAARRLAQLTVKPDVILQIGGLFAPGRTDIPYATFNDFTTALAQREYPAWAPFPSPAAARRWFDGETALYQRAARVFTLSDHTRASMINDFSVPPERVRTVRGGANFTIARERTGGYDGRTLLFVGFDFKRKGGPTLLEAFARVRAAKPDAQLIIVGPRLDAPPAGVTCLGQVADRERMLDLYHAASLFVMPSLCEPFGFVFLEAMTAKLACIGTTNDAMPEIIEHGRTGYVVPPADPAALADAILRLLGDPALLAEMGARGRQRVRDLFTWERTAHVIVDDLEALGR